MLIDGGSGKEKVSLTANYLQVAFKMFVAANFVRRWCVGGGSFPRRLTTPVPAFCKFAQGHQNQLY